jgi:hypothetical protein
MGAMSKRTVILVVLAAAIAAARLAHSGPAFLEGRLGKANRHDLRSPATDENSHFFERDISAYGYFQGKRSMVASAVSRSCRSVQSVN